MNTLDVLGGIELTLASAIVVAALSVVMGQPMNQRIRLAAVLGGWFAVVVTLAATGALHDQRGVAAAGMGLAVVAPIALMWFALRRVPWLRDGLDRAPLVVLVSVNIVRALGVDFLILQANGRLPAPFAPSAGWGDILAGLVAVPVAWMVYRQARGWRAALMAWNVFGMADLISAITLGVLSSPGPLRRIFAEPGSGLMSTLPWLLIPAFLVPLLAMTHLAIFYRLSGRGAVRRSIDPSDGRANETGGFRLQIATAIANPAASGHNDAK